MNRLNETIYTTAKEWKNLITENKKGAIVGAAILPPLIYLANGAIKLYFGVETQFPPVDASHLQQVLNTLYDVVFRHTLNGVIDVNYGGTDIIAGAGTGALIQALLKKSPKV